MKKYLSILLTVLMLFSLMTGCTNSTDAPNGDVSENTLFKAGKYTGEGQGFGGVIKVEVEVSDNEILKINMLEHKESAGISDPALNTIPNNIIENQSVAVDAISGCTLTSNGIIDAVKSALISAGATEEAISKAVEKKAASTDVIKKEADVVIIGSGGAGMSAAVEAIDAGASVIVIDKQSSVGGNTLLAGSALNASDPERQKQQTMSEAELKTIEKILAVEPKNETMKVWRDTLKQEIGEYKASGANYLFDSPSLHKLQTYIDGDFVAETEKVDILGENGPEAIKFLEGLGAKWIEQIQAAVGATWKRSHTPTTDLGTKGASFVLPQANYAKEQGAEIMLNSKAEELIMTDGRCTGVKGTATDGQPFEITANKGVIIATGGFGANVEMRQKYNNHWATLDESVNTTNGPFATGDGIVMAEAIGANLVDMEWIQLIPTYGPGVVTPYIENQFYINKEGNRFVHEDGRRDELSKAVLEQTDAQLYIISDANTIKDGMTTIGTNVDERVGNGYTWKADTIAELAEMINVPAENLQASVDQFNNSLRTGNDPFGRTVFDKEFGAGPFYAGLTGPMVHHTMGGIQVTTKCEVLDTNGNIIPGLFAAGEVTGGVHGANRLGGNAITDVIVFGRIAGQNVVK